MTRLLHQLLECFCLDCGVFLEESESWSRLSSNETWDQFPWNENQIEAKMENWIAKWIRTKHGEIWGSPYTYWWSINKSCLGCICGRWFLCCGSIRGLPEVRGKTLITFVGKKARTSGLPVTHACRSVEDHTCSVPLQEMPLFLFRQML